MKLNRPRYVMIGGFLGAGKTTSILRFAQWLTQSKGLSVGLIMNDQGIGLVDTSLAKNSNLITEEVPGGCFCCRTDTLVETLDRLTHERAPDVFLAEPVGSCTDLIATVSVPLTKMYRRNVDISPLSVLIDPARAMRILQASVVSDSEKTGFSKDVNYIYRKQLEEAEIIVINKEDTVDSGRIERLREILKNQFPSAEILSVSARHGIGLEHWWTKVITSNMRVDRFIDVDYERYASGEAALAWLNATYRIRTRVLAGFDANRILDQLLQRVRSEVRRRMIEVAHLKMCIRDLEAVEKSAENALVAIQWVHSDVEPEFTVNMAGPTKFGELTINVRAEGDPKEIENIIDDSIRVLNDKIEVEEIVRQSFRPSAPRPLHRFNSV